MADQSQAGYVEIELTSDRLIAYATIHPPQGAGRAVTPQDLMEALRKRGVVYGFRDQEIIRATQAAADANRVQPRVMVAQGVLPEDGTDAQVLWKVDQSLLTSPAPRRADGELDLFHIKRDFLVSHGQVIASIIPARPGHPGKTITTPIEMVDQNPGRDTTLTAGPYIQIPDDKTQIVALAEGILEVKGDRVSIIPISLIEGDHSSGHALYSGGVVVTGSVSGSDIRAHGPAAVAGTAAGMKLRTSGDVSLARAARSAIQTEGSIRVTGTSLNCDLVCKGKVIGESGSSLAGGVVSATSGCALYNVGNEEFITTSISVGNDDITGIRMQEIDAEVRALEQNSELITQSLRPLGGGANTLDAAKKALVQKLVQQRRDIEARVRELHAEKRNLMLGSRECGNPVVIVSGTAHPGTVVTIGKAQHLVENPVSAVLFRAGSSGRHIECIFLEQADAA